VVDVHHKPRWLTSLPRCHSYQVHKVQHKPRKKFRVRLKQIWSKGHESVLPMAHRTVFGAPGRAPLEHLTLGNFPGVLHYNSPNCPVCTGHVRWANGATVTMSQRSSSKSEQCTAEVRAVKSEHTGHVRCSTRLSGAAVPTVKSLQTPTGVLTWHAPDSEQYLSGVAIASKNSQRLGSGLWRNLPSY
jgi:hypothetical protein